MIVKDPHMAYTRGPSKGEASQENLHELLLAKRPSLGTGGILLQEGSMQSVLSDPPQSETTERLNMLLVKTRESAEGDIRPPLKTGFMDLLKKRVQNDEIGGLKELALEELDPIMVEGDHSVTEMRLYDAEAAVALYKLLEKAGGNLRRKG